ncbi:MAG TPA: adenosylcobinamide-GDP ribazoletransferase, partial [Candidatus Pelethocola excrementipullorum]|nr:adenosylcobinamide-GDP ribazoletransferase [Candidatus Pelethocola excrementipullorum]
AALCWLNLVLGLVCIATAVAVFCFYRLKSGKYFGGITGDLAGYFLSLCELWMLIMVVITQYGMEKFL